MPTKRTARARGRRMLTLAALDGHELLSLVAGYAPGSGRWRTYKEFLEDYAAVRDEFLASDFGSRGEAFAEWLYQRHGTNVPAAAAELVPGEYPAMKPQPRILVEFWSERDTR